MGQWLSRPPHLSTLPPWHLTHSSFKKTILFDNTLLPKFFAFEVVNMFLLFLFIRYIKLLILIKARGFNIAGGLGYF